MKIMVMYSIALFLVLFASYGQAANLATPAVLLPPARISISGSYDLGGYTIGNDSVPCLINRFHGSITYSPCSFLDFGIDGGATQVDVAPDTTATDTIGLFHGNYGVSGGLHLKFGSPFFYDGLVRVIGICQAMYFSSSNENGALYSGKDAAGILGLQFHIPHFGYISAGPQLYIIMGENKNYNAVTKKKYSNLNNLRGWLSIDYFPHDKVMSKNKLFFSFEMSLSPKAAVNKKAPLQEASFSISFGSITKRLYGEESDIDWEP